MQNALCSARRRTEGAKKDFVKGSELADAGIQLS